MRIHHAHVHMKAAQPRDNLFFGLAGNSQPPSPPDTSASERKVHNRLRSEELVVMVQTTLVQLLHSFLRINPFFSL